MASIELSAITEQLATAPAGHRPADLRETRQLQTTGPIDGKNYFVTFSPLNFSDWAVTTVIPASGFLASIERSAMTLLIALTALTAVVLAIAILLANRLVAAPLLRITGQLKHIEAFHLDRVIRLASPLRYLTISRASSCR